jgi:hypothetical protein
MAAELTRGPRTAGGRNVLRDLDAAARPATGSDPDDGREDLTGIGAAPVRTPMPVRRKAASSAHEPDGDVVDRVLAKPNAPKLASVLRTA